MNAFPPDNPEVSFNPEKMAPEFLEEEKKRLQKAQRKYVQENDALKAKVIGIAKEAERRGII